MSVILAEMNDLASTTSSASTRSFHGGLRYLEYFEINLVRNALKEPETLLRAMPHIAWPMRFVLPYHRDMRFESDTPASRLLSVEMLRMRRRHPWHRAGNGCPWPNFGVTLTEAEIQFDETRIRPQGRGRAVVPFQTWPGPEHGRGSRPRYLNGGPADLTSTAARETFQTNPEAQT